MSSDAMSMPSSPNPSSSSALAAAASNAWASAPSQANGTEHGREVVGHHGAGREEVVHQPLTVDAHGDGLAHLLVSPRLVRVVHAEVERVGALAGLSWQVRVGLDGRQVVLAGVVDAIDRTAGECQELGRADSLFHWNSRFGVSALAPQ